MKTAIILILSISLSACTSRHRIDFHRRNLHLNKHYDRLMTAYYRHYIRCEGLPEDIAADSAAVMLTRVMIESKKIGRLIEIKVH